ncbi:MAG: ABC transporter permease [Lachnospiraceae bacterium]|nr:ABC transporter permease [Lachnospiraceae bacterium]
MKHYKKMVYPYVAWISVMVVAPMLLIMFYAFTKDGNSVLDFVFTLDNFKKFFSDTIFISVLWRSLKIAVVTTVICIAIGYPAGYFISKCAEGVKMRWILLITFPTWINMMVRTYAWRGILQDDGIINNFLGIFGVGPVPMLNTSFAVVLGMVYNFLPFMIIQIYTSLAKLDTSLLEAAADLGANKTKSFLRITLPLSIPGVLSGITLVFLPAVSSFYIPEMLGGGRYFMVGNLIENQFLTTENWNFGSAVSIIMVIIIIISMYFTRKADKTEIMEQRGN